MRKVLVIGGRSSAGEYIANTHLSIGDRVVSTFRSTQGARINRALHLNHIEVQVDLLSTIGFRELANTSAQLGGFDLVYMSASAVPSNCSEAEDFFKINIKGYLSLLSCIEMSSNALVIQMSSMSCFKAIAGELDLGGEREYEIPYPASKNIASILISDYLFRRENNYRFYTLYIPALLSRGNKNNFFFNWLRAYANNQNVRIFNPDSPFNACVDIQVIVDLAIALYFASDKIGELFVCSEVTTLRGVFEALVSKGYYNGGQMEVFETDRPATTLPFKKLVEHGVSLLSVSDVLEKELLSLSYTKEV
jgi:nucleoside-diphosphate-sugar epimerase